MPDVVDGSVWFLAWLATTSFYCTGSAILECNFSRKIDRTKTLNGVVTTVTRSFPPDYFLRGYLKSNVHLNRKYRRTKRKNTSRGVENNVDILQNVIQELSYRLGHQTANETQIEHRIKYVFFNMEYPKSFKYSQFNLKDDVFQEFLLKWLISSKINLCNTLWAHSIYNYSWLDYVKTIRVG